MSLYAVFKIEFHNDKQCYDLLGIFSDVELAKKYILKRLSEKLDRHMKRDPVLTKENHFTIFAKRGSFETKCPGYVIETMGLDRYYY